MDRKLRRHKRRTDEAFEALHRVNDLEAALEEQRELICKITEERDAAKAAAIGAARAEIGLRNKIEALRRDYEAAEREAASLSGELSVAEGEIKSLRERMQRAQRKEAKNDAIRAERDKLQKRLRAKDERAKRAAGYRQLLKKRTGDDRFESFVRDVANMAVHPTTHPHNAAGMFLAVWRRAKQLVGLEAE